MGQKQTHQNSSTATPTHAGPAARNTPSTGITRQLAKNTPWIISRAHRPAVRRHGNGKGTHHQHKAEGNKRGRAVAHPQSAPTGMDAAKTAAAHRAVRAPAIPMVLFIGLTPSAPGSTRGHAARPR